MGHVIDTWGDYMKKFTSAFLPSVETWFLRRLLEWSLTFSMVSMVITEFVTFGRIEIIWEGTKISFLILVIPASDQISGWWYRLNDPQAASEAKLPSSLWAITACKKQHLGVGGDQPNMATMQAQAMTKEDAVHRKCVMGWLSHDAREPPSFSFDHQSLALYASDWCMPFPP